MLSSCLGELATSRTTKPLLVRLLNLGRCVRIIINSIQFERDSLRENCTSCPVSMLSSCLGELATSRTTKPLLVRLLNLGRCVRIIISSIQPERDSVRERLCT
jgi:hypothetical protein